MEILLVLGVIAVAGIFITVARKKRAKAPTPPATEDTSQPRDDGDTPSQPRDDGDTPSQPGDAGVSHQG